tara:strand:+ start:4917 stop:5102 length:186 start_codon:yes stop_codon:yes gene_type:complete
MDNIKIGDSVRLKSGSPLMTVSKVNRDNIVCAWFNDKESVYEEFHKDMLEEDDDDIHVTTN